MLIYLNISDAFYVIILNTSLFGILGYDIHGEYGVVIRNYEIIDKGFKIEEVFNVMWIVIYFIAEYIG